MSNVLISAYACRPGAGSEPGIGWNFVVHAAVAGHHVWVMTRPDNAPFIEKAMNADAMGVAGRIHVVYVDWGAAGRLVPKKLVRARYWLWQNAAARVMRELHGRVTFDVAHHVTYGCYWQGTSLAELTDVPLVWGPVGGGEAAPAALVADLGLRGRILEGLRDTARFIGERMPGVKRTAQRAAVALATTQETGARLTAMGVGRVETFTAMGLAEAELATLTAVPAIRAEDVRTGLRLVSSGRLLDWKGFHLGLRAFAKADLPAGSRLDIIGDGPAMAGLKALAAELGIADRVHFAGHVPRERAIELLSQAHALVHPSLHDSGGWVCLEAMAMGKPVLCLDLGGPALMIDDESGARVKPTTPAIAVDGLTVELRRWASDPQWVARAGEAARQRAKTIFAWSQRAQDLSDVYASVATSENAADITTGVSSRASVGRVASREPVASPTR